MSVPAGGGAAALPASLLGHLQCPVCNARFRGAPDCSRCGADLTRLHAVAAYAFLLRRDGRIRLATGDYAGAAECFRSADGLFRVPGTARAELLARWLAAGNSDSVEGI